MTNTFRSKYCGEIEKLNSLNYLQWSTSMIHHFASTGTDDIVLGQRECPPAGDQYEQLEHVSNWKKEDSRAKGALLGACTTQMRTHIESAETSTAMWEILSKCANSADTEKGRQNLATKFRTIKSEPGEPLSDYFGRLTEIRDLLKGTDHDIVDWIFRDQLLRNLPSSYANMIDIIENKEPRPPIHEIMEILKGKEIDLAKSVQSSTTASMTEAALYSGMQPEGRGGYRGRGPRGGGYRGGRSRGRGSFRTGPYNRDNTTSASNSGCYNCGKIGHRAADCESNNQACFDCGDTTHKSPACPHDSLTREQARKGRSAYLNWTQKRDREGKANITDLTEPETPSF